MTVPRKRSAEEGCKEAGTGFICFDLSRNIRCVNGKVAENQFKPFDANFNLKACIFDAQNDTPGFCGGGVGANQCVGTPEQAIAGLNAGKEFFLEPTKTGKEKVKVGNGGGGKGGDEKQDDGSNEDPTKGKDIDNKGKDGKDGKGDVKLDPNGDPPTKVAKVSTNGQNFCKQDFPGLKASDGTQNRDGACSSTVQGAIPNVNKMVSTIIIQPANGAKIKLGANFTVSIRNQNIETGFFDDPKIKYYATPQTLNKDGVIQGHQHITIESMGNGQAPPDPTNFKFFKGLNKEAENDVLSVEVAIPKEKQAKGIHRICSITGTFGHQPVIMPVAQRGSQDDCIRIQIV
ncbi:hypothetical protein HDU97_009139 [Phlyctochytrium planicorne]|nr:hypothetical protein HDU97_009139 [Phlyctochytrium planicorne]